MARTIRIGLALVSVSLIGGVATASIPDTAGVFHACYDTKKGDARIIDTATSSCTKHETATSWSMIGPMGPRGPQGPQGIQGPAAEALRFGDRQGNQIGTFARFQTNGGHVNEE